jgi:hypothetical protein
MKNVKSGRENSAEGLSLSTECLNSVVTFKYIFIFGWLLIWHAALHVEVVINLLKLRRERKEMQQI